MASDVTIPENKRMANGRAQLPGLDPKTKLPKSRPKHQTWLLYWASINPVICGALGPTLTLLALAGCTDRWRVFWVDGTSYSEKDPKWVIATTVIAIVMGLLANVFLLLRMMARGNPALNQSMSIILWSLECSFPLL
jgi:hypothetical protein